MARTNKRTIGQSTDEFSEPITNTGNEDNNSNEYNTENETDNGGTSNGSNRESGEATLEPPKRHRGRPKGSRNKNQDTVILQEKETINSDGTTSPKYKPKKKGNFLSEDEAEATAAFIMGMVNDLAKQFIDETAQLDTIETTLIGLALPKYLATLETNSIDRGTKLMYPVMGIVGVSLYAFRLTGIMLEKRKNNKKVNSENLEPFKDNEVNHSNGIGDVSSDERWNEDNYSVNRNGQIEWDYKKQNTTKAIHKPY